MIARGDAAELGTDLMPRPPIEKTAEGLVLPEGLCGIRLAETCARERS
jgi:hypothetical protein